MNAEIRLTKEPIGSRSRGGFIRNLLSVANAAALTASIGDRIESADFEEALALGQELAFRMKDADDRSWASAMSGVIADLVHQGWTLQFRKQHLWGRRPPTAMSREAMRERLLVRRDEQLQKSSVRDFIRAMERWRLFRGDRTSILSLMRDGRALAGELASGKSLSELVEPYIQIVATDAICDLTGLRLQDIWRYFRHTWSTSYESVPGRSLQIIVRDRAAPHHPVIGIAAISSAAVRLGPRDRYIGWDTEQVVDRIAEDRSQETLSWARRVIADAIDEIYRVDLIRDEVLPSDISLWSEESARACAEVAAIAKEQHHRLMEAQSYKAVDDVNSEEACVERAELYLFRAKRALELSKLIPLHNQIRLGIPEGPPGRELIGRIVRIARSKTVGTEIADLTVCGAVAPYSHLAAGKLVAMLAVTPEVLSEYQRRYAGSPGVISSSMAGRPIGRPANLCYIGTTSLYGKRPNQYDRLSIPANLLGGDERRVLKYEHIKDEADSRTQGMGTFHFSSRTLKGLEQYVSSGKGGWKANNLFGEGTSPKLRGLRDGLAAINLDADELLTHGIERCMYGVKLASNLDRYLLGMDSSPNWNVDLQGETTQVVARWWIERWAEARAMRGEVLAKVKHESIAHPIRHGARVQLPEQERSQDVMF